MTRQINKNSNNNNNNNNNKGVENDKDNTQFLRDT